MFNSAKILANQCRGLVLKRGKTANTPILHQVASYHKPDIQREENNSPGKVFHYLRYKYGHSLYPLLYNFQYHFEKDKWTKLFCVEGNISSGKTDFAEQFSKILELKNFTEKTDYSYYWLRNPDEFPKERIEYELSGESVRAIARGTSIEKFWEHPGDSVHTMKYQMERLRAKYMQYCDGLYWLLYNYQGTVLKNHFYADSVYAYALYKMNWIPKHYKEWYDVLYRQADSELLFPNVVIYLDVSPEQCYENVQKNGNTLEKKLPLDFYKYIEEGYKELYIPDADNRGVNVIQLDWSKPCDVEEIVDDLDALPTLNHEFTYWDDRYGNFSYYKMMKSCDLALRLNRLDEPHHLYEEIGSPWWLHKALRQEEKHVPWKYRKGFNKKLGDVGYLFRPSFRSNVIENNRRVDY